MVNPDIDPDANLNCNLPAISVIVKATYVSSTEPILSLASIGILSSCDCTQTTFDPAYMQA